MKQWQVGFMLGTMVTSTLMLGAAIATRGCQKKDGTSLRERVELVTWRTELKHEGCKGFWRCSGAPRRVESYGIDKAIWPHTCSVCGSTNEIYDARWPKIEQEWRAVK